MIRLEIDCPPGIMKSDAVYDQIMKDIKESLMNNTIKQLLLFWEKKEPEIKQYGNFEWELQEMLSKTDRKEVVTFIYNKLLGYYEDKIIRYGSVN